MAEFIIDETIIKAGSEYVWLWVAIEPKDNAIPGLTISKIKTCLLPKGLSQTWSGPMENMRHQQTVELGIRKHVDS